MSPVARLFGTYGLGIISIVLVYVALATSSLPLMVIAGVMLLGWSAIQIRYPTSHRRLTLARLCMGLSAAGLVLIVLVWMVWGHGS